MRKGKVGKWLVRDSLANRMIEQKNISEFKILRDKNLQAHFGLKRFEEV